MSCKQNCDLQQQFETLFLKDIVLALPTESDSKFLPGSSLEKRTLQIIFTTSVAFPKNTILLLQLVSTLDESGNWTKLATPICVEKKTVDEKTDLVFEFTSCNISLPKGIVYLPTVVKNCTNSLHLIAGGVVRYRFLFTIKKTRLAPTMCPSIPLDCNVKNGATCDVKCEKPDIVETPDADHPIKIYCANSNSFVYSRGPHCVTHCQAPKPMLQYYILDNNFAYSETVYCKQCTIETT